MDEKTMVNDIIKNVKAELTRYEQVIIETEDINLRQTMQSLRNGKESFQYELFKVAELKGYYEPTSQATRTQIEDMKKQIMQ